MDPEELVSALIEDRRAVEIPAAARPRIAQQMFVHALLTERATAARAEEPIRRALARVEAPRTFQSRLRSIAAAAMIVAAVGGILTLGDALPAAEAMIERMDRSFRAPVDRHYVVQVYEEGRETPLRTNDWYFRDDRWASRMTGLRGGTHWAGGSGGGRVWWVPPLGPTREWADFGVFGRALAGVDSSLPYANLRRAVQELKRGYDLSTVGREGGLVRVRAIRRDTSGPLRQVDLLADEDSGVVRGGEFRFEFAGERVRLHRFTLADQDPRDDAFYTAGGHSR